jgi:hypothetical protein
VAFSFAIGDTFCGSIVVSFQFSFLLRDSDYARKQQAFNGVDLLDHELRQSINVSAEL